MIGILTVLFLAPLSWAKPPARASAPTAAPVTLPGVAKGIRFDDLGFSADLDRLLVPVGGAGKLFLIEPASRRIDAVTIAGVGEGATSADAGAGFLFAGDHAGAVLVVDPKSGKTAASAKLGAEPDYVRYVAATREVWVTEPGGERVEVFALETAGGKPSLAAAAPLSVPGGPESLVVDDAGGRAYTNTWEGETVALDLKKHAVAARWRNGCAASRGIALDAKNGWVFVGCKEGKAVVLDARDGKILSSLPVGDGVDIIAYDAFRRHLYVPGGKSRTLSILAVDAGGALRELASAKTAPRAKCVTADGHGGAWVCDPERGRLLYFKDELAPGR